ncbi:MAG: hypothetical protein R3344_04005, partial [Acidobacteriota bacterium]|nr:hypothetical protein [Acidobacteriota bacterium]
MSAVPAQDRFSRERYRCGPAAVWLPRVLGGALLAAATVLVFGVDPGGSVPYSSLVKGLVLTVAAAGALWIVRRGSEVRLEFGIGPSGLRLASRRRMLELPWKSIETLDYDPPLGTRSGWIPAMVLVDDRGRRWRIPAVVRDGPGLLEGILVRTARHDLRTWAEARRLRRRLERARAFVASGYVLAAAIVASSFLY